MCVGLVAMASGRKLQFGTHSSTTSGVPKVHVFTDELHQEGVDLSDQLVSPFWTEWRAGMDAVGSADVSYYNFGSLDGQTEDASKVFGLDLDGYVAQLKKSCGVADALVVSMPFESGTAGYVAISVGASARGASGRLVTGASEPRQTRVDEFRAPTSVYT